MRGLPNRRSGVDSCVRDRPPCSAKGCPFGHVTGTLTASEAVGDSLGSDAYDRLVVRRPSDEWQRRVDEEAAELARGTLSPELASARHLWPESLRVATDAALAKFEAQVRALRLPSDMDILGVVKRLVLTLNKINDEHVRSGKAGYETDERDELCDYINASLQEAGVDVQALETRHGARPGDIAAKWRDW